MFVNDGSTDHTGELMDKLADKFPEKVGTLHMKKNAGKSEAVRQGILLSIAQSESYYIGYWDADLATPLSEIDYLYRMIKKYDYPVLLMGSRVKILGKSNIQRKARKLLNECR